MRYRCYKSREWPREVPHSWIEAFGEVTMKRSIAGLTFVAFLIGSSCKDEVDLGGSVLSSSSGGGPGTGAGNVGGNTSSGDPLAAPGRWGEVPALRRPEEVVERPTPRPAARRWVVTAPPEEPLAETHQAEPPDAPASARRARQIARRYHSFQAAETMRFTRCSAGRRARARLSAVGFAWRTDRSFSANV